MKRPLVVVIGVIALAAMIVATRAQIGDPPLAEEAVDIAVADRMEAASDAFAAGDYEASLAHYTAVATRYPDHPRARRAAVNIGYVLRQLGDLDGSEAAFRTCRRLGQCTGTHPGPPSSPRIAKVQRLSLRNSLSVSRHVLTWS